MSDDWKNEYDMSKILVTNIGSPFFYRPLFVAVARASWGFLNHEADVLLCTKSGYLTEIEIKVSAADWRQDINKDKFGKTCLGVQKSGGWQSGFIKYFYYAAPKTLAERWPEIKFPEWAGVISVDKVDGGNQIEILKPAQVSPNPRKLSTEKPLQTLSSGKNME